MSVKSAQSLRTDRVVGRRLTIVGRRLFKAAYYVKRWLYSLYTRCRLTLIWTFEGAVVFAGPIYTRAVSGTVIIGPNVLFGPFVTIDCAAGSFLRIGRNTTVNQGTFVVALEYVEIGNDVSIGEYSSVRDNDHAWANRDELIRKQGYTTKPVVIEDDVWIGRGVVIGKGVRIGRGAIVAANAVVVKDVEPYTVVGGVPARMLKRRE